MPVSLFSSPTCAFDILLLSTLPILGIQFQIHVGGLSGSDVDRMGPWVESRCNGFAPEDGLDRSERPVELAPSSEPSMDAGVEINRL